MEEKAQIGFNTIERTNKKRKRKNFVNVSGSSQVESQN